MLRDETREAIREFFAAVKRGDLAEETDRLYRAAKRFTQIDLNDLKKKELVNLWNRQMM